MGNIVWYCSECGDGPIGTWNSQCTSCGHLYCGSCHTDDPYTPKVVQDGTKGQDFERPSTTSYPLDSEARLTIPDGTATPTESLMYSHEDTQPHSHDRTDATQEALHTISPGQTLSEQDDSRSEEARLMDGPSNPLSRLSPIDGSSITRADNEEVSDSYASLRAGIALSSELDRYLCRVADCGATFHGEFDRKSHLHLHHKIPRKAYTCGEPNCGKKFTRSDARRTHERYNHSTSGTKPVHYGQDTRELEPLPDLTSSQITSVNIDSLGLGASQPTDASVRTDSRFEGHSNNDRSVLDDWMNSDSIITEPWGPTNRRHSESSERPPSIVSEDAITLDEIHSQNDSQITNLVENINNQWDSQSVRSIESSTTLVSTLSGYTSVEMESATIELRRVLQEDVTLAKLYRLAIEDTNIGPERLQRNLGRLLKQMAQDLKVEASKELERLTSRFVAVKARNIAHCIVQDLRVTRQARQTHEGPGESESEHEENSIDENRFEDLTSFRTFLIDSGAFQAFQSRLEAFVHPKCLPVNEAKIEIEGTDTNRWSSKSLLPLWLGSICMGIISVTGFVEPQIPSHAVRLNWHCKCGQSFSSDVYECRPGGINRLKDRMQRSGCLKVTLKTYDEHEPRPRYTLQIPSWCQVNKTVSTSFTDLARASANSMCLPLYQTSKTAKVSTASQPTEPPISERERYLLICMHRTQHHVNVNQEPLQRVTTDRQLFCFLKKQLRLHRGRFHSLISMKRVQKIFFVKFLLHKGSLAQIRHHKYSCTQQICQCIPPQNKVIKPPMGTGEYDCNPAGPTDTWPPVCPEFMMHMYHSPQCITEDDTCVLDQVPKKMDCRLDGTTGSLPEGWGLYFQEDIDISTIIAVVFVSLFVASLLFLILWTVVKGDIQGASGVSAYIVAVASMAGIWIATKSKSFG